MRTMILDFETRWSRKKTEWAPEGYTLTKMTTEEYIRDPRFKAFGACYKWLGEEGSPVWIRGAQLQQFFDGIDWKNTAVCCHHAQFDVAILSWIYKAVPALILDTLSMARILRGVEAGNSAAKLAEVFGLPPKGTATTSTDGLWDLPFDVELELADYCRYDVRLCEEFLARLLPGFPRKELTLIDMTVRMFTEPKLVLDGEMLQLALDEEKTSREALLTRLGVEEGMLASNDKFAEALRAVGVEPPTKISKTTGLEAFAFAKNDALFQALLQHDNEDVVLLCEARMRVKSTMERTRAQRFVDISKRGKWPVALSYGGTRTFRWSASKGAKSNAQNLKRGSVLRKAITAGEGQCVLAGDLRQIEPRVLDVLAGAPLDMYHAEDMYAVFGAKMFGIPGMTQASHPMQRQAAKSAKIGAGYVLGWASFSAQLLAGFLGAKPLRYDRAFAKQAGIGFEHMEAFLSGRAGVERYERMMQIPHTCTDKELFVHCVCAKELIDRFRASSPEVVEFWGFLGQMIATVLAVPGAVPVKFKCLEFRPGEIMLPNGLPIRYDGVEVELDAKGRPQFTYMNGGKKKRLHPGIVCENVTSGTARCIIADGMRRVNKRYPVVMTVHDELVAVIPESEAEEAKIWVAQQMTIEPSYLPGIPLGVEVGVHKRYGLAKG